jgi:zinc protease
MTLPIPEGMTAANVVDKYFEAIGDKEKVMAVKTVMTVSSATIQGTPLVMTVKNAAPNKTSQIITVMGNVAQKAVFDGAKGYQEARGQKMDMQPAQIEEAKLSMAPFADMAYKKGKLNRIEPIDGKNYFVITFNETEIFYDMKSGLKLKEIKTVKMPDGKEVKVPTTFSDYKEVDGILFPHSMGSKMGPMDLNFITKEIKINEGVSDADFE